MTFDVAKWKGEGGDYTLSVIDGKVVAEGSNHGIY